MLLCLSRAVIFKLGTSKAGKEQVHVLQGKFEVPDLILLTSEVMLLLTSVGTGIHCKSIHTMPTLCK